MVTLRTQCPCLASKRALFALSLIAVLAVANVAFNHSFSSHTSNKNIRSLFAWGLGANLFNLGGAGDRDDNEEEKRSIAGAPTNLSSTTVSKCELSPNGVEMEFLKYLPVRLPDDYSKPMEVILNEDWVCDLQRFLSTVDPETRLVNMIAANSNFTEPLVNWLIGSYLRLEDPMKDVIVISLDSPLHELLIARDFPSLLISPDSVMYTEDFPEVYHEHNGFYQTRMMVMRLINHWGYNTANYDTDALILKNPQAFYDDDFYANFDIMAGFAISFPLVLHKKWGATLCNGAWMVRSNPRTELFWEHVAMTSNAGCEKGMDQCKVNFAFDRMKLNWTTTSPSVATYDLDTEWTAFGDVNVIILPLRIICRQRFCEEKYLDDYYIWHKGSCSKTAEAKRDSVLIGGLWWLRDDWKEITQKKTNALGTGWLSAIANYSTLYGT